MPASIDYVFDTGPLIALATGLPSKVLFATSFIANDYKKINGKAMPDETFRRILLEQVARKEEAGYQAYRVLWRCITGPGSCIVPRQVVAELSKYKFNPEVARLLALTSGAKARESLVKAYNKRLEAIGRGDRSKYKQTVNPVFFERIVGPLFTWAKPDLASLKRDPVFQDWLRIIQAKAREVGARLSTTDAMILAYTAYRNEKRHPTVAVIADRGMKKVADKIGIPYIYAYEKTGIHHPRSLGRMNRGSGGYYTRTRKR